MSVDTCINGRVVTVVPQETTFIDAVLSCLGLGGEIFKPRSQSEFLEVVDFFDEELNPDVLHLEYLDYYDPLEPWVGICGRGEEVYDWYFFDESPETDLWFHADNTDDFPWDLRNEGCITLEPNRNYEYHFKSSRININLEHNGFICEFETECSSIPSDETFATEPLPLIQPEQKLPSVEGGETCIGGRVVSSVFEKMNFMDAVRNCEALNGKIFKPRNEAEALAASEFVDGFKYEEINDWYPYHWIGICGFGEGVNHTNTFFFGEEMESDLWFHKGEEDFFPWSFGSQEGCVRLYTRFAYAEPTHRTQSLCEFEIECGVSESSLDADLVTAMVAGGIVFVILLLMFLFFCLHCRGKKDEEGEKEFHVESLDDKTKDEGSLQRPEI